MREFYKIFLLLPFLSKAMPGKNDSRDGEMLRQSLSASKKELRRVTEIPSVKIPAEIFTLVSKFVHNSTALECTHPRYFHDIAENEITGIYRASVNFLKACKSMLALARMLSKANPFHYDDIYFPDYISLWGPFPKEIRANLTNLIHQGKYKYFDFSKFIPRIEVSEIAIQDMLSLGCIQEILKNVAFRSDLSQENVLHKAKEIVSKFEYVTKDMLVESSPKRALFFAQLAEKIKNDTCFIVLQDYATAFGALCGTEIAKMNIVMIIEEETDLQEAPFYPALLSIYALAQFDIHDPLLQNLQLINLVSLSNAQHEKDSWSECYGSEKDLSLFDEGELTAYRFLGGCSGLICIDLSSFSKITHIGSDFLAGCYGLTSIDFSPLRQVKQIQNEFLYGCSGLTHIDLSPLTQVTKIGARFLFKCTGLTHLNLSGFENVSEIAIDFLDKCPNLKRENVNTRTLPANHPVIQAVNRRLGALK